MHYDIMTFSLQLMSTSASVSIRKTEYITGFCLDMTYATYSISEAHGFWPVYYVANSARTVSQLLVKYRRQSNTCTHQTYKFCMDEHLTPHEMISLVFSASKVQILSSSSSSIKQRPLSWGFQQSFRILYLIIITVATSTFLPEYVILTSVRFRAKARMESSARSTGANLSTYESPAKQEMQSWSLAHCSAKFLICGIILLQR